MVLDTEIIIMWIKIGEGWMELGEHYAKKGNRRSTLTCEFEGFKCVQFARELLRENEKTD